NRRRFLVLAGAGAAAAGLSARVDPAQPRMSMDTIDRLQKEWKNLPAPSADVAPSGERLARSEHEWKKHLTPEQYRVLREEGTERAGTSSLNDEKRPGVFVCAGCSAPLFTSAMKYESGTGWHSFFTTIPGAVATKRDFKLILPRTEYHCVRCDGHHGPLYEDGPHPTRHPHDN